MNILGTGADGYGYLLAGLGTGSILAATLVPRLERLPRLGPDNRAYFYVLLADGSVRPAQKNLPDPILRSLITSKGNEVIGVPW